MALSADAGGGARATFASLAALGADGAAVVEVLAAAAAGVAFAEADAEAGIEEAPGFAVFFEHGAGLAAGVGIEADAFVLPDGLDRDDIPNVFGDYVADEEIDFFAAVDFAAGSGGFDAVARLGVAGGGFDLDAEESVVEFDNGIVAVTVSPGDTDAEAEGGGAGEEGGFGGFSETLAGGLGAGLEGDGFKVWKVIRIVVCVAHKKSAAGELRLRDAPFWKSNSFGRDAVLTTLLPVLSEL